MRRNSLLASTVVLSTLYSPSSQQQQREFSAFDGAIDIHMLAVHSIAGDGNHGVALKTLFLLVSFSLLLFQTYVLHTMGSDLAMTTCNSNEDCPQGLSCLLEKEVNRCMDCSYQKECFEGMNMISTGEIVTYVGMRNNTFTCNLEDMSYCEDNDVMPSKCDYYQNNLSFADQTSYAILFFVTLVLASFIIHDMDMATKERRYLSRRAPNGIFKHMLSTLLLGRRMILPFTVAQAVICSIISDAFKPINILLNALSITFILEADDIFGNLFIKPATRRRIVELQFSTIDEDISEEETLFREEMDWLHDRVIGLLCGISIIIGMQYLEFLGNFGMKTFMSSFGKEEVLPCDELWLAAGQVIFLGALISLIMQIARTILQKNTGKLKLQEVLSVIAGFSIMFVFIMIGYISFQLSNPNVSSDESRSANYFLAFMMLTIYVLLISSIWYLEHQRDENNVLPNFYHKSVSSSENYADAIDEIDGKKDWLPSENRDVEDGIDGKEDWLLSENRDVEDGVDGKEDWLPSENIDGEGVFGLNRVFDLN